MADIKLTFWTLLFLVASAQGLFLSAVLFKKKGKNGANYFLATLVLLFSVTLIFYVFFWSGISNRFGLLFGLVLKLVFLFGPLAYMYLKSARQSELSPGDLRHFYLFPLVTLLSFITLGNVNFYSRQVMPAIECASLIFYTILIFRSLDFKRRNSNQLEKFHFQYAILFAGFTFSYISYYLLYYTGLLRIEYDYAISLSMAVFIYFIGYRAYFLPEISGNQVRVSEKYERSGLTETAEKIFAEKLIKLMSEKKLFADSELKLRDLAEELQLSPHYVSQVINSSFKQTYSDFVNGFRIKEAVLLLNSKKYVNEPLIGIAYACGFNNKVSFNNAFRKVTGISPGKFRKLNPREKRIIEHVKYHPAEA